jgi:hypothetical protein
LLKLLSVRLQDFLNLDFGADALNLLKDFYGQARRLPAPSSDSDAVMYKIVNGDTLQEEYQGCKEFLLDTEKELTEVKKRLPRMHEVIDEFIQRLHRSFPRSKKDVIALAKIALVLPMSTASNERSFSLLKLIKKPITKRLSDSMLDALMRIRLLGPPIEKFDFVEAVKYWHARKDRRVGLDS